MKEKWTVEGRTWFGDSVVTLVPVEGKPLGFDTTGLTKEQKERILLIYPQCEKLWFDTSGVFHHSYYLSCPVGETWPEMGSFELENGIVFVTYRYITWKNKRSRLKKNRYKVVLWSEKRIELRLSGDTTKD